MLNHDSVKNISQFHSSRFNHVFQRTFWFKISAVGGCHFFAPWVMDFKPTEEENLVLHMFFSDKFESYIIILSRSIYYCYFVGLKV